MFPIAVKVASVKLYTVFPKVSITSPSPTSTPLLSTSSTTNTFPLEHVSFPTTVRISSVVSTDPVLKSDNVNDTPVPTLPTLNVVLYTSFSFP